MVEAVPNAHWTTDTCKRHIFHRSQSQPSLPASPGPEKEPAAKRGGLQLAFDGRIGLRPRSRVIGVLGLRTVCLHFRNLEKKKK